MARSRTATGPQRRRRAGAATDGAGLTQSAERMIVQIEALVAEILALRADNDALRGEVREAVTMLDRASAALGGAGVGARPAGRRRAAAAATDAPTTAGRRRRGAGAAPRGRGRVTPSTVTAEAVLATIGKRGTASAKEIAEDISKLAGEPVSGRAIRFIAERAGAKSEIVDGQRRYRLA